MKIEKLKTISNYIPAILVSAILVISALGKAIDFSGSALALSELFNLPPDFAHAFTFLLICLEIIFIFALWVLPKPSLCFLPLAFLAVTVYSQVKNLDCGCFGNLPVFSSFPIWGHYLLLIGMACGVWFHTNLKTSIVSRNEILKAVSVFAIVVAFVSLLFPAAPKAANANIEPIKTVSFEELASAQFSSDTLLIDARGDMQYQFGTIGDAISIPHDSEQLDSLISEFNITQKPAIVFCSDLSCDKAEILCRRLKEAGCKDILIFPGGWDEWVQKEAFLD